MSNLLLIGFMGCGKSTVGIRLSYKLRRVVEDTDKLIEKKEGLSIYDIFTQKGETVFRQMETECLKDLLTIKEERVISTGGGLPMKRENHALLRELGTVFYLRISPESVWERLKNDTTRPLLQCENPLERIRTLLHEREPLYAEAADVTICVDHLSMEQVLNEIIEKAEACGCITGGIPNEDFGD